MQATTVTRRPGAALRHALVLALALVASACGGGGDPAGTVASNSDGINGGGVARGTITGFGSIFVNGVEFSTSGASVVVEGVTSNESALRVGQVVTVQGTIAADGRSGTARTVTYVYDVEGPVQSVNVAANTAVVLGQAVRVSGTTVFANLSPASLAGVTVGSIVEVSGLLDAGGAVVASRIEAKVAGGEVGVTGRIAGFDPSARRFTVNALTVDYANATVRNGTLATGACVEAKGTTVTAGVLLATRIEVLSCTLGTATNDKLEVEGYVTRFASATDFDVGNQRVTTGAGTSFVNGTGTAAASDLRVDLKVEVEGTVNASGVLEARKVEIRPDSSSRLLGSVESVNAAAGTLSMYGVTVTVNASTQLEDKSRLKIAPLRLADLRTGDYLELRGFRGSSAASVVATRLERQDTDTRLELQGLVTQAARPSLTILGVAVTTTGGTAFRNLDGSAMTADAFFAAAANRTVKLRGSWNGAAFTATEAELQGS